ncbi:hypothetical protein TNCV_2717291 [Trichonephila clavipes]|nr:hypothetical protein TNCV_2717291 [Trichonephila clavipes]
MATGSYMTPIYSRSQTCKRLKISKSKATLAAIQAEIRRGIDSIRSLMTPVEDPAIVFASAQLILLYLGTAAVAFPARPDMLYWRKIW